MTKMYYVLSADNIETKIRIDGGPMPLEKARALMEEQAKASASEIYLEDVNSRGIDEREESEEEDETLAPFEERLLEDGIEVSISEMGASVFVEGSEDLYYWSIVPVPEQEDHA